MDRLLNYLIVASFRNNETDKNKVKCKSNKHKSVFQNVKEVRI